METDLFAVFLSLFLFTLPVMVIWITITEFIEMKKRQRMMELFRMPIIRSAGVYYCLAELQQTEPKQMHNWKKEGF